MRTRKLNPRKFAVACTIILTVIVLIISLFKYIEYKRHLGDYQASRNSNISNRNASTSAGLKGTHSDGGSIQTAMPARVRIPINWASIKQGALPVLMYHAVDDKVFGDKDLFVSTQAFDEQMKYLHDNGYTTIDFNDIKNYKKFQKPILITFDDGYENNYTNAYPVLKKYGLKATIFVITGFIGRNEFLTADQIKQMSDVISFQSHTVSHIKLSKADKGTVEKELSESKSTIEKLTGRPVIAVSYPYGAYNTGVVNIAKKYYKIGISTNFGYYFPISEIYEIKRIAVDPLDTIQDFAERI